jgi:hypothetical protein
VNGFWYNIKDPAKIFDFWSISKKKSISELGVVQSLLENLAIDQRSLKSTGKGKDPPDCVLIVDSLLVGVEVVALIDHNARELSARSRREKKLEYYAEWSKESFRAEIEKSIAPESSKNQKWERARQRGSALRQVLVGH